MMQRLYGIPYPGTFVLDSAGRVTDRFFEAAYQERSTVSSIAVRLGNAVAGADQAATRVETDHLEALVWTTDDVVAPGNPPVAGGRRDAEDGHARLRAGRPRLSGHSPAHDGARLPARPRGDLSAVRPVTASSPWTRRCRSTRKPFRLVQDVTIPMRQDIAELASEPGSTVRIEAVLEYQACDHEVCYLPQAVPLSWDPVLARPAPRLDLADSVTAGEEVQCDKHEQGRRSAR